MCLRTLYVIQGNLSVGMNIKYLYTYTYVQYKKKCTIICPHTLYLVSFIRTNMVV